MRNIENCAKQMRHSLCSPFLTLMRRTENLSCSRDVIFPSGFSCDAKKCSFPPFRLKHADRSFYEDSHKMTKEVGCDKQGLKAKRPSSLLSSSLPPFLPFSLGGRQRATSARPSGGLLRRAPPGGEEGKSRQRRQTVSLL